MRIADAVVLLLLLTAGCARVNRRVSPTTADLPAQT